MTPILMIMLKKSWLKTIMFLMISFTIHSGKMQNIW